MTSLQEATPTIGARLRNVLGRFLSGVTLVTTLGPPDDRGAPAGMTATALTSLSLDPSLAFVCVHRAATVLPKVCAAKKFAVAVPGGDQLERSMRFKANDQVGLDQSRWSPAPGSGSPVFADGPMYVDFALVGIHPDGHHVTLIGTTEDCNIVGDTGAPLIWFRGKYRRLERRTDS